MTNNVLSTTKHLWFNSKLVSTIEDNQSYYQHTDNLGSTGVETNTQGSPTELTTYYSFGQIHKNIFTSNDTLKTKDQRKYTSRQLDQTTNLTYANQRYLNTKQARFISEDIICKTTPKESLVQPQSLNCYSYVLNNPYKYTDLTGDYWGEANLDYAKGYVTGFAMNSISYFTDEFIIPTAYAPDNESSTIKPSILRSPTSSSEYMSGSSSGMADSDKAMEIASTLILLNSTSKIGRSLTLKKEIDIVKNTISIIERPSLSKTTQKSLLEWEVKGWKAGARHGYKSKAWRNDKNQLPKGNYQEYDIAPKIKGENRNSERFVRNTDTGEVYYTTDHYKSFTKINSK